MIAQLAQALAGHATESAHERYLRNSEKDRALPEQARPQIDLSKVQRSHMQQLVRFFGRRGVKRALEFEMSLNSSGILLLEPFLPNLHERLPIIDVGSAQCPNVSF